MVLLTLNMQDGQFLLGAVFPTRIMQKKKRIGDILQISENTIVNFPSLYQKTEKAGFTDIFTTLCAHHEFLSDICGVISAYFVVDRFYRL